MDDVELVIFDCDGTLVDSEPLMLRVMVDEAVALGMPRHRAPTFAEFEGQSMGASLALLEQRIGQPLPAGFEPHVRACMAEVFRRELREIPGARSLLEQLRVPYCVASNGPRSKIELVLEIAGLLPLVGERVFSAVDLGVYKPEPALFLHAAAACGATPARCAVVEDSLAGLRAGVAAGMRVYAYRAPHTIPPELAGSVTVLERLADLAAQPWHRQGPSSDAPSASASGHSAGK